MPLSVEQKAAAYDDMRSFHDACIKELYSMLGIDGSDGEYRFKWAALEVHKKLNLIKKQQQKIEDLEFRISAFEDQTGD